MNTFKIMQYLSKGDRDGQYLSYDDQIKCLNNLGEPKTDIERSFFQYKCQMLYVPRSKVVLFNILSVLVGPFLFLFLFIKGFFQGEKESVIAIGEFKGFEDLIPEELSQEFHINNNLWDSGFSLSIKDFEVLKEVFKVGINAPYFFVKALLKIASYSYLIHRYHPKAIIVHGEYSFCSSLLTRFCNYYDVEHINAMHGEKTFYIGHSFFHYNRCYVWDEFYAELLSSMKAEKGQFIVSEPVAIRINLEESYDALAFADYKYYLQEYDQERLKCIVDSLKPIKNKGNSIKFRPHPRFSDVDLLKQYVSESDIEWPNEVAISKSIASCRFVIGFNSTVLFQAYKAGRSVILDDVAFKKENSRMEEFKYILSNKKDIVKLSKYLKDEV